MSKLVNLLVIISLLVTSFGGITSDTTSIAGADPETGTPQPPPAEQRTAPPWVDPQLPSLTINLEVTPRAVAVGDLFTVTLTVNNQAAHPANNLVVSMPLPVGTVAQAKPQPSGWSWQSARLDGESSTTMSAMLRLVQTPPGDAILVHVEATARGLSVPVTKTAGALVVQRGLGAATTPYAPGVGTTLRSPDGRIEIKVPPGAADRPLTLQHSYGPSSKDEVPPQVIGFKRGFPPFYLNATDVQGRDFHQFSQPLTLTISYTPQQLEALGFTEEYLSLFWVDESQPNGGQWVTLPTNVDPEAHTVTAFVDHFSVLALGEDFRPSEKFIPSLKEWQVGLFRGDVSFDYEIEVPKGPGGIKPEVKLSYNSSAPDGPSGLKEKHQSSWAGKGWNLETGYIANNKMAFGAPTDPGHYSLVLNGQTFDLMRAEPLIASPSLTDPTHYAWRTTNESFNRIRVITNGTSTTQRGGYANGQALPRHKWQVWTKDGTRYDFEEDAWWGWTDCPVGDGPMPADPYSEMQAYKWHLSKVEDTHGNIITYTYWHKTASAQNTSKTTGDCGVPVSGTVDYDVWPKEITWGGALGAGNGASPRYKVVFTSVDRTIDTDADQPANQLGPQNIRETQQLEEVLVYSNRSSPYSSAAWELVSRYDLIFQGGTDWRNYLLSDASTCNSSNTICDPITTTLKLTLKEIRQFGSDNTTYLPPVSFTYGLTRGTSLYPQGAWNRLTKADNNQGGVATFEYLTIASTFSTATYAKHYKNNRRVSRKLFEEGRGNTYSWSYSYGSPAYNSLGTLLTNSDSGPNTHPTSATVYYNEKRDLDPNTLASNRALLAHKRNTEFRGHSYVKETDPNGNQTEHWFYQGDTACYPKDAAGNPLTGDAILTEATCFMPMRDREFLKGKEWKTVRHQGTAGANINLAKGKAATQSSTDYSGTADRAVDGNTDGNYSNGSVTHTLLNAQTWWQVDMGAIGSIGNIDLWNRADCCADRLANFDVFVSDVPFVSYNINETRDQPGVSSYYTPGTVGTSIRIAVNRTGRYVRVQLRGTNYMNLAEVQVWSGNTALSETQHEFTVKFYEYGDTTQEKLTGLWRAFAFEHRTTDNAWELGSSALAKKTEFVYDINTNPHYGNLLSTKEYNEAGTVTRETTHTYKVLNNSTHYIVDRKRSDGIKDGLGNWLARTVYAYDGSNGGEEALTKGDLTLVRKYHNMPATLPATPATIESSDTRFGYDAWGNETSSTTYTGYGTALTNDTGWSLPGNSSTARTKSTQYDTTFNVFPVRITETVPSLIEQRGYDLRMGTQTSETDYNGITTLATYDVFGRISKLIKHGDTDFLWTAMAGYYDWEKPVRYILGVREVSGVESAWRPTITLYDGMGREIQTKKESVDGYEHVVEDKRYDGLGQLVEQSQPRYVNTSGTFWDFVPPTSQLHRPTKTTYDALGRKTQVQEPGPSTTTPVTTLMQHAVSGSRKVVTTTDPNRHILKHESDVLGRLLAVKEYTGNAGTEGSYTLYATTSYDYSPLDLLKEATDTKGKKITMQYDTLGRKKSMTDLAMGAWSYTYDPNGNLKTQKDAKNQTITFGYDAMDRLTSKTYPGATTPERTLYTYDVGGTYGKGRRTKMERFAATSGALLASTAWQYDQRGRKIKADHTVNGLPEVRTFDWTYDSGDRITSITYPLVPTLSSREVVSYSYDAAWRPTTLCSNLFTPCYVTAAKYSPLDQPQEVRLGNNLWNAYIYNNPTQRLQQIKVGPNGDGSIFNRTYSYDNASNVKSIVRSDGGASETQNFTYDHRDRLKAWNIPGAQQVVDETYTYDEVGNLLTKVKKKNATQSDTYGYIYDYARTAGAGGPYGVLDVQVNGRDNPNYTYDANGNLLTTDGPDGGEKRSYTWNADNQPTTISQGGCGLTENYVYDADGERVKQTRGNNEHTYHLEGIWWEKRHSNGAAVIREMYKFNGQVVAQREVQPNRQSAPTTGLRGDYYNTTNSTNFQLTRYDTLLEFNWGAGSPDPTVPCDRFSIEWNGSITPNETGTFSFYTRSDDGVRLWVNDQLIIDNWTVHPPTDDIGQINLTAGVSYQIRLQYFEEAGGAEISLKWQSESGKSLGTDPEAIPQAQLSPPQADLNAPTTANTLTYLHSDHLGSVSVVTDNSPSNYNPRRQEFDPWGLVRNPPGRPINDTTLNYTGQQLDGTDLLYYHARYYDPKLSRFVSPDSIVPGVEDGKGGAADSIGAVQNHKLTVDFHEPGFISSVQKEHDLTLEKGFWFQLKEEDREAADLKDPWGPANPQALNRYAYVMNNPVRYTDPTGHVIPLLAVGAVLAGGIASGVALDVGIDYATTQDKGSFDWGASARNSLKDPLTYVGAVPIGKLAKVGKLGKVGKVLGAGCGFNSFSGDTEVATVEGEQPIGEIQVGDLVLAYDEETGTTGYYTVTAVLVHEDPVVEYLTIDGEQLETTPEHPFYTQEEQWVEAGSLWRGAHVRKADGTYGVVQAIEMVQRPQVMYNLTVAEAHTFFVGDGQWLVHNTCPVNKLGAKGGRTAYKAFSEKIKVKARAQNPTLTCVFCKRPGTATEVDHAYARSLGGNATLRNAQMTCRWCNRSKGNRQYPVNPPPGYIGPWPRPDWR